MGVTVSERGGFVGIFFIWFLLRGENKKRKLGEVIFYTFNTRLLQTSGYNFITSEENSMNFGQKIFRTFRKPKKNLQTEIQERVD